MMSQQSVVVTGAAGGIGRAVCERLSRNGWHVLAVDRDKGGLSWVTEASNVSAFAEDVTSEEQNLAMIEEAEKQFGGVDAVILNAAITTLGTIESTPWADIQKIFDVNISGVALGMRAALPALRRRGGGSIVATSSLHGIAGETEQAAYSASKHAVVGLVKSVARDVGWEGIRVNAVCPGTTRGTGMTGGLETAHLELYKRLERSVPLQRWAEPDEIAAVMEFLVSPAASYVNGIAMPVDGGVISGSGLLPPTAGDQHG